MGMFDYLICESPLLPQEHQSVAVWQTKDTPSQFLETYRISPDNRLIWEEVKYDGWVEGNPASTNLFDRLGHLKSTLMGDKPVPFHGYLTFYANAGSEFIEYRAKFTDDVCVLITRLDPTQPAPLLVPEAVLA